MKRTAVCFITTFGPLRIYKYIARRENFLLIIKWTMLFISEKKTHTQSMNMIYIYIDVVVDVKFFGTDVQKKRHLNCSINILSYIIIMDVSLIIIASPLGYPSRKYKNHIPNTNHNISYDIRTFVILYCRLMYTVGVPVTIFSGRRVVATSRKYITIFFSI